MQHIITIISLLVFAWVNYQLGFKRGFADGYNKGANKVLDEWREWLYNVKENTK